MCLGLQQPHRGPSGKLIKSIGGLFGRSWIGKSLPGSDFLGKSRAYFNDFIFRPERFLEGLERVLGVCSRAKEGPKGGPGKIFKFTLGSKGGPKTKKDPRQTTGRARAGRKRRPRAPGKTIVKDFQSLTGRRTRTLYHALGRWPGELSLRTFSLARSRLQNCALRFFAKSVSSIP